MRWRRAILPSLAAAWSVLAAALWSQSQLGHGLSTPGVTGVHFPRIGYNLGVLSTRGTLILRWEERVPRGTHKWSDTSNLTPGPVLAVVVRRSPAGSPAPVPGQVWQDEGVLAVRWWLLTAPGLAALVASLVPEVRRRRAARRAARGLCPACGYDLRASSRRCPECGWAQTEPAPQASAGPG